MLSCFLSEQLLEQVEQLCVHSDIFYYFLSVIFNHPIIHHIFFFFNPFGNFLEFFRFTS